MRLGLRLPDRLGVDLRHDVVDTARTAEAAGYASVWVYERLLFPRAPIEPYAAAPNVPWPEHSRQAADPLAVLTAAAGATEKVCLGTSVLVAPPHGPVQLAKALATVDQISGGRLVAGLGTGWSTDELQATGATRADRGRFLDETPDVFDAVRGPDPVTFRGSRVVINSASILPKPVSKIPVMLGGGSLGTGTKAVERVAERAVGWLPLLTAPGPAAAAELRANWDRIRKWPPDMAGTRAGWRWSWSATSPSPTARPDLTERRSSARSTRSWTTSTRPRRRARTSSSWT